MPTLIWAQDRLDLPDLDPPYAIAAGLEACRELADAVFRGELSRTSRGVAAWIDAATGIERTRRRSQVDLAMKLLAGCRLEDAEDRYANAYRTYLLTDPYARAAHLIARAAVSDHPDARWAAPIPAVLSAVLSSR